MDDNQVYSRQHSSGSNASSSSSAAMSRPDHHRRDLAAGGISGARRARNPAAQVANARLARAMASRGNESDEDEDDDDDDHGSESGLRYGSPRWRGSSNGGGAAISRRASRNPSNGGPLNPRAGSVSTSVHQTALVHPSRNSLRTTSPIPAKEPPIDKRREKRFPADLGHLNSRETGGLREASALQEELDMLQEENSNFLEKLRLAEERCEEAQARAKELEKQVANLGEGFSLEARLLSRREALLREKEVALKAVTQAQEGRDEEKTSLRQELESAREEVAFVAEQLREAESEAKSLHTMTQRMILTQEEMEEVVLKRCWLARYWGLAVQHGIYLEIAASKYEHWSSLASLPLEVVISAGQKAKEDSEYRGDDDLERRNRLVRDLSDMTGEGNIESMLSVEKGLRELASLKVEDAVMLALARNHRLNLHRLSASDPKSPADPKFIEAFGLNQEESEDVLFKQAWLTYFWRRAITHGVEEDIADERLQFWLDRSGLSPTSQDAVDVERGLIELRKLGIEQQLWETSRREIEQAYATNQKLSSDAETVC